VDRVVDLTADLMGTHFLDFEVAKVIVLLSISGRGVDLKISSRALTIISFRLSALDSLSNSFGSDLMVLLAPVGSFITLLLVTEVSSSFDWVIFIGDVPLGRRALLTAQDGVAGSGWTWALTALVSVVDVFCFYLVGFKAKVSPFFCGMVPLGVSPSGSTVSVGWFVG
jgi:hypothetical protein